MFYEKKMKNRGKPQQNYKRSRREMEGERKVIVGLTEFLCDGIYVRDVYNSKCKSTRTCVRYPLRPDNDESSTATAVITATTAPKKPKKDEEEKVATAATTATTTAKEEKALRPGTVVRVRLVQREGSQRAWAVLDHPKRPGSAQRPAVLAQPGSAMAASFGIACTRSLDPCFSEDVMGEVEYYVKHPGTDDPELADLTGLPFVTIDGTDSRDLDQAMYIRRAAAAETKAYSTAKYVVYYALADASYYVRPGTAIFAEAMRRGASYYMPGLAVPMLPLEFSEGIVSLNEGKLRRALTFQMVVDASGMLIETKFFRAKIVSRAKLSYEGVQRFHDGGCRPDDPLGARDFTETLLLLKEFGNARIAAQNARNVVRFQRAEYRISAGSSASSVFSLLSDARLDCEKWNEQVSLICNIAGAKALVDAGGSEGIHGIWRIHSPPSQASLAFLKSYLDTLAQIHEGQDAWQASPWVWRRDEGETLAHYIARLPRVTVSASSPDFVEQLRRSRISRAINRAATMCCVGAVIKPFPGTHFGIGAEAYARFSSPMRQMEGIYLHAELLKIVDASKHSGDNNNRDSEANAATPPEKLHIVDTSAHEFIPVASKLTAHLPHCSKSECSDAQKKDKEEEEENMELGKLSTLSAQSFSAEVENEKEGGGNNGGNTTIRKKIDEWGNETASDKEAVKMRDEVIKTSRSAKSLQSQITKEANRNAIDSLFLADLKWPQYARPVHHGTVLGIGKDKKRIYVELDTPPVEVKVYLEPLQKMTGKGFRIDRRTTQVHIGDKLIRVGDEIGIRVVQGSVAAEPWVLEPCDDMAPLSFARESAAIVSAKPFWAHRKKIKTSSKPSVPAFGTPVMYNDDN